MSEEKTPSIASRLGSARMNRRKAAIPDQMPSQQSDSSDLNFRVQDKGANDPDAVSRKSRISNILKDGPSIKGLKEGAAETIKRPLTGLFRRPGSKAGRKKEEEDEIASAQPPSNFRGASKITSALEDVVLNDDSPRPDADRRPMGASGTGLEAIARAPMLTSSQLHPMLSDDNLHTKFAHLYKIDDIDISLLARGLLPEEETREDDSPWTWDHLFASLSSELREEWATDNDLTGRI